MIKNFWKMTKFYCLNHPEPILMEYRQGPKELFYACEKYYPDKRTPDERACANNMYTQIAEVAIDYFSNKIEEALIKDERINLTNEKFVYKNVEFVVLKHSEEEFNVGTINRKTYK
jgi:hypothetical protein